MFVFWCLNSCVSNWPLFFARIYHKPSFSAISSVIFWPGLQVPMKSPFLQTTCRPDNHHHCLLLSVTARLWSPGPQQIQYHRFPLMPAAVMTSRKHWNWQKMLKKVYAGNLLLSLWYKIHTWVTKLRLKYFSYSSGLEIQSQQTLVNPRCLNSSTIPNTTELQSSFMPPSYDLDSTNPSNGRAVNAPS